MRSVVLRLARRQMWRERARLLSGMRPVAGTAGKQLREKRSDLEEEASAVMEGIEERQAELKTIAQQQQEGDLGRCETFWRVLEGRKWGPKERKVA